jgi:hypothetical protein
MNDLHLREGRKKVTDLQKLAFHETLEDGTNTLKYNDARLV